MAVAFLALAFVRARERQLAEQQRLGERAQDNAETAARALDAAVLQAQILLESVTDVIDPAGPPERNDAVLASLAERIPYVFSNISVVDTLGRNIGAAILPVSGRTNVTVADREYFQRALRERQFTVGTPVRGRTNPGAPWVLPFMLPMKDKVTGRVVALAGASILLDSLDAVRSARQLPHGSVLTVLDSTGTVMIRTLDTDRWIGRLFPNRPTRGVPVQRVGNDTTVPSDIDAIDRLFGTEQTHRVAWRVFVGMPVDVVFGPSRSQFAQDLLLGLVIGVGIIFIGYWLTARFVAPIASLTQDAQAISAGNMSRRSQITSQDEVGELAAAFNHMADAIVERNEQLAESQAKLRQAQKLEALGAFAGGIAHDFNNYLSSIIGHGELALEQLAPEEVGAARVEVESMLTSATRAAELTRQILVFSRRQVVTPTDFDVNTALLGMQRLLTRLLGDGVKLQFDLAKGLGGVRMDTGQFEQILVNLAVNARDAMHGAGTFTVRTSRRSVQGASFLCLEAEDAGPGVPPLDAERIFEPFFTTKERLHGTGLGLSIAYSIIGAAGGSIAVDQSFTIGARFVLLLPEGPPVAPTPPTELEQVPLGRQERVLLVDDDPGVSLVSERLLRRGGYQVQCASDAEQALELLTRESFDLLITDVVMPGISGPQLARDVVQRLGPMRILFISGYPDDDVLTDEMKSNHAAFLPKPFTRVSLLRAVRESLDRDLARTD